MESQVEGVASRNVNKYNDLRIIVSLDTHKWFEHLTQQMAAQRDNQPESQLLEANLKSVFTEAYLQKNRDKIMSSLHRASGQDSSSNARKSQNLLKDFTLTNVRQTAVLTDIKIAIEKLKGYKVECQSLTMIDEADLSVGGEAQSKEIMRQIVQSLKEDKQQTYNGKSVTKLNEKEMKELAWQSMFRLNDEKTLQHYNVL